MCMYPRYSKPVLLLDSKPALLPFKNNIYYNNYIIIGIYYKKHKYKYIYNISIDINF